MSDHSVTFRDVTVLRDILDLTRPDHPEDQVERTFEMLELIDALVGADWVSFQTIDACHRASPYLLGVEEGEARRLMTAEDLTALRAELGEANDAFWDRYWTSTCSLPERTGRPVVFSECTFRSQSEWRNTRRDEDLDLADELFLGYPIVSGASARILLGRDEPGSPFGHRELTLMELLEPHLEGMLLRTAPSYRPRGSADLTARQVEILRLVGQGLGNKQIGRSLGISEGTVRKHLENSYTRLGVLSRTAAVFSVFGTQPSTA